MNEKSGSWFIRLWKRLVRLPWYLKFVLFVLVTVIPTVSFWYGWIFPDRVPPKPSPAGWPVSILIDVDKEDETLKWTNDSLTDRADAPEIVLRGRYSDGTDEWLVGSNYESVWAGNAIRSWNDHPCDETFSCLVTGEVVPEVTFEVEAFEVEKAVVGGKLLPLGSAECTLNKPCAIGGVGILIRVNS